MNQQDKILVPKEVFEKMVTSLRFYSAPKSHKQYPGDYTWYRPDGSNYGKITVYGKEARETLDLVSKRMNL